MDPDFTVTLTIVKNGIYEENSGEIRVSDISVSPEVYERFGLTGNSFENSSLIRDPIK